MLDSKVTWGTANFLHLVRNAKDPSGMAWYSILLGYPVLGIWYWCCDQTIVQRVLAARNEKQARLGPLFCAFLKIFPVFLFVLPGVICVALVQQHAFGADAPAVSAPLGDFFGQRPDFAGGDLAGLERALLWSLLFHWPAERWRGWARRLFSPDARKRRVHRRLHARAARLHLGRLWPWTAGKGRTLGMVFPSWYES